MKQLDIGRTTFHFKKNKTLENEAIHNQFIEDHSFHQEIFSHKKQTPPRISESRFGYSRPIFHSQSPKNQPIRRFSNQQFTDPVANSARPHINYRPAQKSQWNQNYQKKGGPSPIKVPRFPRLSNLQHINDQKLLLQQLVVAFHSTKPSQMEYFYIRRPFNDGVFLGASQEEVFRSRVFQERSIHSNNINNYLNHHQDSQENGNYRLTLARNHEQQ